MAWGVPHVNTKSLLILVIPVIGLVILFLFDQGEKTRLRLAVSSRVEYAASARGTFGGFLSLLAAWSRVSDAVSLAEFRRTISR